MILNESNTQCVGSSATIEASGTSGHTSGGGGGISATMINIADNESSASSGRNTLKSNAGSELFLNSCSAAAVTRTRGPKCELDEHGCLSLSSILESFSSAINEEHAWAICFQFAKTGQSIMQDPESRKKCHLVSKTGHMKLHRDGYVHEGTFLPHIANNNRQSSETGPTRIKCTCEYRIISKLAVIIFTALDYGLQDEEERHLSPDLVALFDAMAAADESAERPETDDEGIERDAGDLDEDRIRNRTFNFQSILERCSSRLVSSGLTTNNAREGRNYEKEYHTSDSHYKAICRALVAEALELSNFLEKVSQGNPELQNTSETFEGKSADGNHEFHKLHLHGWAKSWVHVVDELKNGVKLKKVDSSYTNRSQPIENKPIPYENLMDDIRSRRYKLNKVMVNGSLPMRVKNDAHEIILDFIRSRPPLKKVTERILPPPPQSKPDPIEALMESIRKEHHLRPIKPKRASKKKLKSLATDSRKDAGRSDGRRASSSSSHKTKNPVVRNHASITNNFTHNRTIDNENPTRNVVTVTTSPSPTSQRTPMEQETQPQRRLIKADFDFLYSLDTGDFDDDDNDPDQAFHKTTQSSINGMCFYSNPDGTQSTPASPCKSKPAIGEQLGSTERLVCLRRRHTICNPTMRSEHAATLITFPFEYTNSKKMFDSLNGPAVSPILHRRKQQLPRSVSKSSIQEEFFQSNHWQTAMECLSLNLDEVVHIRFVLTKAELEALPVDCSLKEDVEKGKICFLCLKTRFALFGHWGNQCKLCKRMVCARCCCKMRIPTDNFSKVPVSSLNSAVSPGDEEKELPGSRTPTPNGTAMNSNTSICNLLVVNAGNTKVAGSNGVGSAPTSPNLSHKSIETDSDCGQRSISPGLLESEERDIFSPDHSHTPYSLPSVSAISLGLMAFKRRNFGKKGKDDDKTGKLKGSLMVVCHDCKAMVLQIIRSSRAKKASNFRNKLSLERPKLQPVA